MSNVEVIRIAIIINVVASYREGFYDRLMSRKDMSITIYCQENIPGLNIKTIHNKYSNNVYLLKCVSAKRERLSWQFIPWKKVLSEYDVVFIEGNPRNISHVLFASYLLLKKKNVVLWTMAHSFRANMLTENIRLLWSRIFKYIFVYSDAEVKYLRNKGFIKNIIIGMNNGLDQCIIDSTINMWPETKINEWKIQHNISNRTLLLSCARLEYKNKYHQFIKALPAIVTNIPNILWCIIGNGPEKEKLEYLVKKYKLSEYVKFVGEIYNEYELAPWFLTSELFIHPAAIGLSIMHAFGYGLPVVTHGNSERQNPEYAAFEAGLTGLNFMEDNVTDLSDTVIKLLDDNIVRIRMKKYVQYIARNKYNVDVMVERFVDIAKTAVT